MRHQLAVYRRTATRPRLRGTDRLFWVWLVRSILAALAEINRGGVAVFLVEQNVQAALTLAHRAYVLEGGRIVGQGSGAELLRDPHVRRAYLGPLAVR